MAPVQVPQAIQGPSPWPASRAMTKEVGLVAKLELMVAGRAPKAAKVGPQGTKESVQEWAQRMATSAPPMGVDALGVVATTLREAAELRAASTKTAA